MLWESSLHWGKARAGCCSSPGGEVWARRCRCRWLVGDGQIWTYVRTHATGSADELDMRCEKDRRMETMPAALAGATRGRGVGCTARVLF